MNSRLATQLAKAVAGPCAFACAETLMQAGLPRAPGHCDGEDRMHPGDSRV